MYTVSITSQGQMSIPAPIRVALGLRKKTRANVTMTNGKMVVEPAPDLLSLAGSLNKYAIKGKGADEIIRMEEKAWERAAVERYKKSLKKVK